MKRFIRKTILIIILPAIIGFPLFVLFVDSVSNLSSKVQLDSNVSRIYIGDSHIQKAINDSLIPNSLNLATSSESFYFSYFKLKIILENNPSIEEVYLGLSYHSLSNYYDDFIYGNYSAAIAPKYFYLMPHEEQIRVAYCNKVNFIPFIKSIVKQGLIKIVKNDYYPFLGGYSNRFNNTKAVNSSMDKRLSFQYYTNGVINDFSEINIEYLYEIDSLCRAKNVKLYTLNTPLFDYYDKQIPDEYKNKLSSIIKNKQLDNIDLSNLRLNEYCFIPDGDHVSILGAEAASVELNKALTHNTLYK